MTLPLVLDASVALVVEGYQSLGADWWTALETAQGAGETPPPTAEKTDAQRAAENEAVFASIMGTAAGSLFKGAK